MEADIFNQVFQRLADASPLSDSEIARRLGVNRSTILRWKTGEQSPPLSKIPQIATLFDVQPTIFISGEIDNSYEEMRAMFKKFSALDSKGKHTIRTVLDAEYKRCLNYYQPIAAHNDDYSEEQIRLMREDLDEL